MLKSAGWKNKGFCLTFMHSPEAERRLCCLWALAHKGRTHWQQILYTGKEVREAQWVRQSPEERDCHRKKTKEDFSEEEKEENVVPYRP